ncbi:type VI secretion system amidase effector protein Tae4 [Candidatus Thiosymbion oneisti]|uniref:type VI secretion system amidase effector protein Tae4 n=1 Tax=Candidatus Thiosymbion oneisti TaxID=589554 RepID=UPI00105E2FA9|nr:type VI secretion system amidase effector protein Tae4 [Candidatus Thiosymbion oneisti]
MLSFRKLWDNHPYIKDAGKPPCTNDKGKPHFNNQCAIRMGIALERVGMNLNSFRGVRCWHGHKNHILRAEELAKWLRTQKKDVGTANVTKKAKYIQFLGKKGIIFFKDGWPRGGDHIDVWNGVKLAGGLNSYFTLAKEVWFWKLN